MNPRFELQAEAAAVMPLRVLVVDDTEMVRKVVKVVIESKGADVVSASSGEHALELLDPGEFDVIISDINMPGLSGIDLLRFVRSRDPDLPVLLMTGSPEVETAVLAVEYGATRYLAKPIEPSTLWSAITEAGQLRRLAKIKRDLQDEQSANPPVADLGTLTLHFEEALESLRIFFQPIVDLPSRRLVAYEVLCRTSSEHLPHPGALFDAAERLDRVIELGRAIRSLAGSRIGELPADTLLFVNIHPEELADDMLIEVRGGLREHSERVVLEVTERQTLDSVVDPKARITRLKAAGFRVAVDDLGAGYAGLSSFVQLEPDIVKVDMSLVRGVDTSPKKQRLIESLVALCAEMGTQVVVEGVETTDERDALSGAGCSWMQGYLFGRPGPEPATPSF